MTSVSKKKRLNDLPLENWEQKFLKPEQNISNLGEWKNLKWVILEKYWKRQNQIVQIEDQLNQVGLTDNFTFTKLKEQIFNSTRIAPNWEAIPDFPNMLSAIKIRKILRGYQKKAISIEDLLGLSDELNNKAKVHMLLDSLWLTDQAVFEQLKYIMENAYYVVRLWQDDYTNVKENKTVNMAVREYSLLKDYIEDDNMNALNLFKVNTDRLNLIFGGGWLPLM